MPQIKNSCELYGYTDPLDFFGAEIAISASLVEPTSSLFGQTCFEAGTVKTTYGTGCFMLMNTGDKAVYSNNGLLTTIGWGIDNQLTFALDAGVYTAGAAIQWLRDGIKIIDNPSQTEEMANSVSDTGGVYFVPAFSGLASPYWDQYARGMMIGITGGTTQRTHSESNIGEYCLSSEG